MCVQNLFVKKNKEFKTALITSFILLLAEEYPGTPLISRIAGFATIVNGKKTSTVAAKLGLCRLYID